MQLHKTTPSWAGGRRHGVKQIYCYHPEEDYLRITAPSGEWYSTCTTALIIIIIIY